MEDGISVSDVVNLLSEYVCQNGIEFKNLGFFTDQVEIFENGALDMVCSLPGDLMEKLTSIFSSDSISSRFVEGYFDSPVFITSEQLMAPNNAINGSQSWFTFLYGFDAED